MRVKRFKLALTKNPSFNTVVGLVNTTFDPENVVSDRGATEGQIKFVHDKIAELQAWLDENGCSNDPYQILCDKLSELEANIDECCANPQDSIVQELSNRLTALEQWQCPSETGYVDSSGCDGNVISVNFQWTSQNKTTGKASATSSMNDHNIVSYDFIVQVAPGVYKKSKRAGLGDFHWEIDNNGNVTMQSGGSAPGTGIVVTDDHGCEGTNGTSFWNTGSVIGG